MKRLVPLALVCALSLASASGQQRPLITERASTLGRGEAIFDIGIEFLQNAVFNLSGLEGDLTRAGVYGFRFGAADNVEIQFLGTIQDVLNVENRFDAPNTDILNFSGGSTSDWGNLTMATKVRLLEEREGRPTLSMRFGVVLPNTSNESGLGNDETDFTTSLLVEKNLGRGQVLAKLGLVLLGDPVTPGAQDDLFAWGAALTYAVNPRVRLLGEASGRTGAGGIGTEDQARVRVGARFIAAGLHWDVAAFIGLEDADPETGIVFGISKQFKLVD